VNMLASRCLMDRPTRVPAVTTLVTEKRNGRQEP
jgi:hypothetical protein